jgi:hypothetical protein
VITETAESDGVRVSARIAPSTVSRFTEFVVAGSAT